MDGDRSEFDELGDELRQAVGGEFRRTAEEDEFDAAKAHMRSRTLEHVGYELLARGDKVAVSVAGAAVPGVVVHAKGDLLALKTPQGRRVDVRLGPLVALHVVERSASGGRTREQLGAESFVARLRELELEEAVVIVTAPTVGEPLAGIVGAVTADHMLLRSDHGGDWYVPLGAIAAVTAG